MGKSTRGYCKYCGKEYTRTGMVKHLQTCKRRVDLYEKATETEKYFELLLYGAYNKDYWLLPVTNSPRMGVCGYEGSSVYPEQFEPDEIC